MKAMILAAGRGERMKPLTDTCPKPLLKVAGIPLIEHHIKKLKLAGITDIVINHAWLGEKIEQYFADGQAWGVNIQYSLECDALETAGGIIKALPLLGDSEFLIVNGDIYCDMPFTHLPKLKPGQLAHLFLVKNPEHNPNGDFYINDSHLSAELVTKEIDNSTITRFTYSGIGIYHPKLFLGMAVEKAPLAPILKQAMQKHKISGTLYQGLWSDIGTPQRLEQINQLVS
ncbi:N-acetylmuramate alpha-1-phosphate uridylyltransferase MurU [Colwelliaceae bacterium BS250]